MGNQNLFWYRQFESTITAGQLFNPISLVRISEVPELGEDDDPGVGFTQNLDPYAKAWAKVDLKPAWILDGTNNNQLTHRFIIRERKDLTIESKDVVIFNNRIYRIKSIEDVYPDDLYRRFTALSCSAEGDYKDRDVVVLDNEGAPVPAEDITPTDANPLWSF